MGVNVKEVANVEGMGVVQGRRMRIVLGRQRGGKQGMTVTVSFGMVSQI
jgi:hypothetical protein